VIQRNIELERQADLDAARLVQEQAEERAVNKVARVDAKAHKKSKIVQEARGIEIAKEVEIRKNQITLDYNKAMENLGVQQDVSDLDNTNVARGTGTRFKSKYSNLVGTSVNAQFGKKNGASLRKDQVPRWRD
jgi:uncharacterized protein YrzB (UPF0473 family)